MKKVNFKNKNFISKAKAIHGENYLYNLVRYRGSSKKVNIICKKHGVFSLTPNQHLSGKGCPFCEKNRLTRNEFMELMTINYGEKYDFTKCTYSHETGINEYLTVTCKVHGDFRQKASALIKGHGCEKCAREERRLLSLQKHENTPHDIAQQSKGIEVNMTYPVVVKFQTLDSQNNAFLWTEPFESKTKAEQYVDTLKIGIEMCDSIILEATVLEKSAQFIDAQHAYKLLLWLNLDSIEAYTCWWDSCKPSFIPRNIREYYSGVDKYLSNSDVKIIISILDRIKLSDEEDRQVA
jgi:hypothetical protein